MADPASVAQDGVQCEQLRNITGRVRPEPWNRPTGAQAQIGIFYFTHVAIGVFWLVFAFFKHLHPRRETFTRLKHRPVRLFTLTVIGISFASVTGSWFQAHALADGLPCWLYLITNYTAVPLLTFPLVARLLTVYRQKQWTDIVVSTAAKNVIVHQDEAESVAESVQTKRSIASRCLSFKVFCQVIFCRELWSSQRRINADASASKTDSLIMSHGEDVQVSQPKSQAVRTRVLKLLKSERGTALLLSVLLFPYVLTGVVNISISEFVAKGCYGCAPSRNQDTILIVESVVALVLVVITYRINLDGDDAFGIISEARLCVWGTGIWAVLLLILNAALKPQLLKSDFQFLMPLEIVLVIYGFIQSVLQCMLAVMEARGHGDNSSDGDKSFSMEEFKKDFLSRDGRFYASFCKHLANEYNYESLAFLESVEQWENLFYDLGPKTSRARAKRIATMFVGEKAELPCNLPSQYTESIWKALDDPAREIRPDFFATAKAEIIRMLYADSFRRFLKTTLYARSENQGQNHMSTPASISVVSNTLLSVPSSARF